MCGRMNISDHEGVQWLLDTLGISMAPTQKPRYNIAPTQSLDVVMVEDDEPVIQTMSWGISMKTKGKKGQPITRRIPNSRDDKVWTSYLWRYLIPEQRVLIPVNGFYEWKRENKKGIYRRSKEENEPAEVSIVTTSANKAMSDVHDRMPVILSSQNAAMSWIQESESALEFTQVSDYVNKSTNEGDKCIAPAVS